MTKNDLLGIVLPTNNPEAMKKYVIPSLKNVEAVKSYVTFLLNFQPPWDPSDVSEVLNSFAEHGLKTLFTFNKYEIKRKGLVPVNRIREDTARINPHCKYYMIFDDDMSFLDKSQKMQRNAGEQLLESLIYLEMESHRDCGVLVFGGSLVKKIKRDSIASIDPSREYVTGRGIIFRRISDSELLVPAEAYDLLGSDEEKIIAGFRISRGYYVAEMPFVRINHYENQLSARNKSGKIPGKDLYEWNTDEIKDSNNFKYIRESWNPEYTSGKGNIVSEEIKSKIRYPVDSTNFDFEGFSLRTLQLMLERLISK